MRHPIALNGVAVIVLQGPPGPCATWLRHVEARATMPVRTHGNMALAANGAEDQSSTADMTADHA